MNRQVVAGILGLALAGCAQDRSALKNENSKLGAVEMTPPMPSIHEAINLDTESLEAAPEIAENTPVAAPVELQPETPVSAAVVTEAAPAVIGLEVERLAPTDTAQPSALSVDPPATIAAAPSEVPATVRVETAHEPEVGSNPAALPAVSPAAVAVVAQDAATPNPPSEPMMPQRDPLLGANPDIMPMIALPAEDSSGAKAPPTVPASIEEPPAPGDAAVSPSSLNITDTEHPPSPTVDKDPLLGDHPDIMPVFDLPRAPSPTKAVPPAAQAATLEIQSEPAALPAPRPVEPGPAAAPQPALLAPAAPVKASSPGISSPTKSRDEAVAPAQPLALPENILDDAIELPPLSAPDNEKTSALIRPASRGSRAIQSPGTVLTSSMFVDPRGEKDKGQAVPKNDSKVAESDEAEALRSKLPPRSVFEAGKAMAKVGEELITLHELKYAVKQRRTALPPGQQLSSEDNYRLAKGVLNDMVDRALVLQDAKRAIKNPKQMKMFMDMADKVWTDEELPPLLRKYAVSNIYELKQKLTENNDSIEQLREAYRQDFLFRGFIDQKLGPKMKVELPEMIDYYNKHLNDFDQAAQITWREVVIEVSAHPGRAEAKKKADAALARLRRGDDFAAVAANMSEGPNKAKGGLWKTAPGSYNVASVNAAIETLPIHQISQVVESPTGYHIVRVESRRPAGPLTFAEVQDKIRHALRTLKVREHSTAYLEVLRKKTPVSTVFDDFDGVQRTSAEVDANSQNTASK